MKALIILAIVGALSGCNDASIDRLNDTPQEHQERLTCEMGEMSNGHMSAENAEAFCNKSMEAARSYRSQHGS